MKDLLSQRETGFFFNQEGSTFPLKVDNIESQD